MAMGKNQTAMLAFAVANAGWHPVNGWNPEEKDKRASKTAAAALEASGQIKTRVKAGVAEFSIKAKAKRAASGSAKGPKEDKGPSKLEKVIEYARANPDAKRKDLMAWMATDLGMSKQGASTYVQLSRKAIAGGVTTPKAKTVKAAKTPKGKTATAAAASTTDATNSTEPTASTDAAEA